MVRLRMVIDCFREAWEFLEVSGRATFTKLLKITTLSYLVMILFLLIAFVPLFMFFVYDRTIAVGSATFILLLIFLVATVILGTFLSSTISSVSLNVIDGMFQKREVGIKAKFMDNLIPMLKWSVFHVILFVLLSLPYFVLIYYYRFEISVVSGIGYNKLNLLGKLVESIVSLISIIINFFIMFGFYELIIARQGLFPSLLRSINLVKNNFIETITFVIIEGVIGSLLFIPLIILFIGGLFIFVPLLIAASSIPGAIFLLVVIGALLLSIIFIFFKALETTILVPPAYIYWKKIREKYTD